MLHFILLALLCASESGNIPDGTVAKIGVRWTMPADRGKVECFSTIKCTGFSSLVLFRLRDVSHPAEEAFVSDLIEKGSGCLRSPTSTLPVQYVYTTPISIVFTRSFIMSSTVSPARVSHQFAFHPQCRILLRRDQSVQWTTTL